MDKYTYHLLTQLTVIIHLLFILFVVVGGFFIGMNRRIRIIHITSVVWAIYAELSSGVICPLTSLENYFAYHAGLATYEDDFVTRYLIPIIYQENLTRSIQFIIVGIVIGINAISYTIYLRAKKKQTE